MLNPIFYCNFHSGCIICCIDIPYAYIQKISFFTYFGEYVRLKSVRIWEFPGLNFWAPSWKWFLKDISFRKQHQKSSIYKCTNRPFLCISCLTILTILTIWYGQFWSRHKAGTHIDSMDHVASNWIWLSATQIIVL